MRNHRQPPTSTSVPPRWLLPRGRCTYPPSSLLGPLASPPSGFLLLFVVGLFTIVRCYPLPRTSFAPRLGFCTVGKLSRFVYGRRYGVRTLGRSRPRPAGLVPLMGKASVSNITVPLGLPSSQKPLTWSVCWLWLARSRSFLSPPPVFVPLLGYSYRPLAGWHPTATPPSLAAFTHGRSPRLRFVVVLHHLLGSC